MARLVRPLLRAALAVAAIAALVPSTASAITLGSTVRPTALTSARCDQPKFGIGHVYWQAVNLPGLPSSAAPTSGSISSWQTDQFGGGEPGGIVALAVVRPSDAGVTVIAKDVRTLPPVIPKEDVVFVPETPVPIAQGDFIGIWGPDDKSGCIFFGGENNEFWGRAAIGPILNVGGPFPITQQFAARVNIQAELGPGGPTPPPTVEPPPLPPTLPPVTPPPGPTFGPDGKPLVDGSGKEVTIDTGQNVGCTEAGPCKVVTTAATWFGTGGPASASAGKKKSGKRKPSAKRTRVVVGTRTFVVPAGKTADVTFKLNRKGTSALKAAGKLRIEIVTTVKQGAATPVTSKRTMTVKQPKEPKPKKRRGQRR